MSNTVLWFILFCMILLPVVIYLIQKYNLEYYKLNGRTPLEIEAWLKTRKWYNFFKFNIQQEVLNEYKNDNGEIILDKNVEEEINIKLYDVLCGSFDKETISAAFSWINTPEGTEYWGKREHEFLAWYFGQYIDLHLLK